MHNPIAKILLVQFVIRLTETICRQTLAVLHLLMHNFLKFCKHGLAIQRALKLIQEIVYKIRFFLIILGMLQQIVNQQRLITGRCHFCHKNPISGIRIRLCLIRIIAVDGMSHFMGKCKHMIEASVVIQQYIRMCAVSAPGIGAASLALIFIDINPATGKSFFQNLRIFLSKRSKTFFYNLLCLLKRIFFLCLFHKRNVHIVHMQFIHTHNFLSQIYILIHFRQIFMYRLNQSVVHFKRNVAVRKCCLA